MPGITLSELLKKMIEMGGSDLHITTNSAPRVRVHGRLRPLDMPPLTAADTKSLAYSVLTDAQKHRFEENLELDFSFGLKNLARFRGNVFNQRGAVGSVFRTIPWEIKGFDALGLPQVVKGLCDKPRGLVLVTGPTGSGKSTTLAAMLDKINGEREEHMITIEDPIEFLHNHKKCLVNQREVHADTHSFANSLRAALREDPDVVLIGEMRDLETIESALRIAETGHLTFATLHTNSASSTINRIIDVFPSHQQPQIRAQLSMVLEGILCQALLPRSDGRGRAMIMEVLVPTPAIRNLVREDKIHQIYSAMQTGTGEKGKEFNIPTFGGGVNAKELAIFTRQFSVMIDAGLPLVQCLEILASQQENKFFQKILAGTRAQVEGGATLSAAMRSSPKAFDALYVNMVEAGETGGILDTILQRLSTYIEKNVKLQRAVKSALVYPVGVLTVAGGVITLLLWKVVPIFATLFAGLGVDLPLPTRIVMALSNLIGSWFGFLFLIAIVVGVFAIKAWYGTPGGRLILDRLVLRLPVLGILMRKIAVARFTRTLGTLISSGVPILEGLDITARTAGNAVVERALQQVRKSLEEGKSLTEPLKESEVFPGMVTQMIAVGEQTGAMDAMLQKIADFYEEEVDAAVKDLLTALEPIMIVFLGLVVGGVVISMYLPLFSLIGKLANH